MASHSVALVGCSASNFADSAESLIAHLKAGDRLDDFLEGFPTVSREQAEAFLELALHAVLAEASHARPA